jgi:molecular chaperone GrpE
MVTDTQDTGSSAPGVAPDSSGEDSRTLKPESDEPIAVEQRAATPDELAGELAAARAKADENWDQLLRARAEMENLRRRHATELEKAHKFALDGFVRELLQVRDSLELGHGAAQEEAASIAKLREGTELTLKLLGDVMSKFGVEVIEPLGETFDPQYHQAMAMQPRDDVAPNTVVTVVQKGYTLNGRLVRPAMVMVSRPGSGQQA